MSAPLIGVSLELMEDPRGRTFTLHQLRAAYVDAIAASGGLPILLAPVAHASLNSLFSHLDGLVITGGAFDISPDLYGESPSPKVGVLKPERTDFEWGLLEEARAREVPILAICGGMQLLNVVRGGTLYQHLPDELPGLQHEQPTDRRTTSHSVQIEAGTRLAALVGQDSLPVNSSHHQGVRRVGEGLRASAHSSDGLVEAIESREEDFCVGVEWHPELLWETELRHRSLFQGLVLAAGKR
jgi:putative glutamine amidotransferase